ncbi:MAG TPA: response regulator [Planctomycetota bacterium]|nr:response regulator [Planctomycetota bacterium]
MPATTAHAPVTLLRPRRQPIARAQTVARVLLVEDEPVTAEVFARALTQAGLEVRLARDGIQALHSLRDHRPDLVVLDLGLPSLSGVELLRRLRELPMYALPVVVVSGWSQHSTSIDGDLLQPGRWITKPARPSQLLAKVRELLQPRPAAEP